MSKERLRRYSPEFRRKKQDRLLTLALILAVGSVLVVISAIRRWS